MCPPKPPKVVNPAAAPAPAAQGADSLKLGGSDSTDLDLLARQGIIGRSLLKVGRGAKGAGVTAPAAASGVGGGIAPSAGLGGSLSIGPSSTGAFSSGNSSGGSGSSSRLAIGRNFSSSVASE